MSLYNDLSTVLTPYANKIKRNESDIGDINERLTQTAKGNYPVMLNATKNAYIDNTGKLTTYNGWTASDYIPCDGVDKLSIYAPVASNYNAWYSDANEASFLNRMQLTAGENNKDVPLGTKYLRLSNTTAAMNGTVLIDKANSRLNGVDATLTDVNVGRKIIGQYVYGQYVDNISGDFIDSASYKRTGYIDISEYSGKQIYFTSNYKTPFCCFYDDSYQKVSPFVVYVGETLISVPANAKYCAISCSRYNTTDVVMYDVTYSDIKALGISNIRDINLKYLDRTDILAQMATNPLFLVYTDLHAYPVNFNRIADFYNSNLKAYVTYPITLGDMVRDQATEDIAWMDTDFGKATLKVIGNHDVLVNSAMPGITELEAYNKYLKPDISTWGVIQPSDAETNGYTYYYKDTVRTTGTIRMIVLDEYYYTEAQHNWFVSVLADAKANNISVIVCQHQSNVWNDQATPLNDKWAFATPEMGFDLYITKDGYAGEYSSAAENRIMAVNDFIGNGGKFICWMSGHTHSDQCHTLERSNGKQLSLVFSNAGMSMTSSKRFERYSSDCFQYVAVDLQKKYVYVLRIGEATDKWFHKNTFLCYDYLNHAVKEYH